jgi:hypothetical protein
MAVVIKGWHDDSRQGGVWCVAGFVGFIDQWDEFEQDWPLLLDTHQVPYLHMREMANPNGVYAKWHPPKEHYAEMAAFFADVAKIIGRTGLHAFGGIAREKDVERFNAEHGLNLQPYSLAAYGSMIGLYTRHPREPVELVFDHVEKIEHKLALTRDYADSDSHYAGDFDQVVLTPLAKEFGGAKKVLPLQAADFFAWEWRKLQVDRAGWWDQPNKPEDWDDRWREFEAWMDREKPRTRKSIMALMERTQFAGLIWDYDKLCEAHKVRGGVWA